MLFKDFALFFGTKVYAYILRNAMVRRKITTILRKFFVDNKLCLLLHPSLIIRPF